MRLPLEVCECPIKNFSLFARLLIRFLKKKEPDDVGTLVNIILDPLIVSFPKASLWQFSPDVSMSDFRLCVFMYVPLKLLIGY